MHQRVKEFVAQIINHSPPRMRDRNCFSRGLYRELRSLPEVRAMIESKWKREGRNYGQFGGLILCLNLEPYLDRCMERYRPASRKPPGYRVSGLSIYWGGVTCRVSSPRFMVGLRHWSYLKRTDRSRYGFRDPWAHRLLSCKLKTPLYRDGHLLIVG